MIRFTALYCRYHEPQGVNHTCLDFVLVVAVILLCQPPYHIDIRVLSCSGSVGLRLLLSTEALNPPGKASPTRQSMSGMDLVQHPVFDPRRWQRHSLASRAVTF
jgi:hypothetical protein